MPWSLRGVSRVTGIGSNTYQIANPMDKLQWDFMQLCKRNRDGAFATQEARRRTLDLAARELKALGFPNMRATSLKPRHVEVLVKHWEEKGIEVGTVKNRMSHIRWWAEKVGKPSAVPNENAKLGIPERKYVSETGKQIGLSEDQLTKIGDERIKASLLLEAAFGLRREEALKFRPEDAIRGDLAAVPSIHIKASWAKGGRAREIPVCNNPQRRLLALVRQVAGNGSMIPPERSYAEHLKVYEAALKRAGIAHAHSLRHGYAQRRYLELTDRLAPHAGGPRSKDLTPEQKARDEAARLTISAELGHGREEVSAVYLGR
jgi:integrase